MLYLQYLRDNGNDVQGAYVARRDPATGDVASDQATAAASTMALRAMQSTMCWWRAVMAIRLSAWARHTPSVVRCGVPISLRPTRDSGTRTQFVTNLMYSWIWLDKNMSGAIEYYYNGFGRGGDQSGQSSSATRGELFTIGRHYLAAT